jgi:hypothetical protein
MATHEGQHLAVKSQFTKPVGTTAKFLLTVGSRYNGPRYQFLDLLCGYLA